MLMILNITSDIFFNHVYPYINFPTCIRLCSIKSYRKLLLLTWFKGVIDNSIGIKDILLSAIKNPNHYDKKIIKFLIDNTRHPFIEFTLSPDLTFEIIASKDPSSRVLPFLFPHQNANISSVTLKKIRKLVIDTAIRTNNSELIKLWSEILDIGMVKYRCLMFMIDKTEIINEKLDWERFDIMAFGYYSNKYNLKKLTKNDVETVTVKTFFINEELDRAYKTYLIGWVTWDMKSTGDIKYISESQDFDLMEYFDAYNNYNKVFPKGFMKNLDEKTRDFLNGIKVTEILPQFHLSQFLEYDKADNKLLKVIAANSIDSNYIYGRFPSCYSSSYKSLKDIDRIEELLSPIKDSLSIGSYGVMNMIYHERTLIYLHNRDNWYKLFLPECPKEIFRLLSQLLERKHLTFLPEFIVSYIRRKSNNLSCCSQVKVGLCIYDPILSGKCIFHTGMKGVEAYCEDLSSDDETGELMEQ